MEPFFASARPWSSEPSLHTLGAIPARGWRGVQACRPLHAGLNADTQPSSLHQACERVHARLPPAELAEMLRLLAEAEAYCPAPVVARFAAALAAAPALPLHAAVDGVWAMLRLDWQVRPWSHSAPCTECRRARRRRLALCPGGRRWASWRRSPRCVPRWMRPRPRPLRARLAARAPRGCWRCSRARATGRAARPRAPRHSRRSRTTLRCSTPSRPRPAPPLEPYPLPYLEPFLLAYLEPFLLACLELFPVLGAFPAAEHVRARA